MQVEQIAGRQSGAQKYDILSALMAFALSQDKNRQRLILRLMSLITTRYNWQRNELCMGQKDIATLWCVDERTVKRELAKLRALEWLIVKRKGSRGHNSVYSLDLTRVLEDTRPVWPNIGTDFVARVQERYVPKTDLPEPNVIPFRKQTGPTPEGGQGAWAGAQAALHAERADLYGAWFHGLTEVEVGQGRLILAAPTKFHATYVTTHLLGMLTAAVRMTDPSIHAVQIIS